MSSKERFKKEIMDAYLFLRENNHSISDEVLDFIKDTVFNKLESQSFVGVAENFKNSDGELLTGISDDGIMMCSDNEFPCKCYLEDGKSYQITVRELK